MDNISPKHIAFSAAGDINQIISPLKLFDINHLVYVKKFIDGSHINLSNRADWTDFFYRNQYNKTGVFESDINSYQTGYILWDAVPDQSIFKTAKERFNLGHGITIIKKWNDSCEFFYLGTTINKPELNNFYINNLDLLDRFILYFRDRGSPILQTAARHKILLPQNAPQTNKNPLKPATLINDCQLRKQFLRSTKIKNFYLHNGLQNVHISNRELDCIKALLEGATAAEIGERLLISKRTAEKHIDQIRHKLNCEKKSALIKKLLTSELRFCNNF